MARQLAMKGAAIPAVIHVLKEIEAQKRCVFLYFSQTFPKIRESLFGLQTGFWAAIEIVKFVTPGGLM